MKIKKILNNIGAVSKQAIIGGAIGVATLAVGIGLMNNFTGSGSEQGFASNALERGYSSYDSSYSGAGTSAQDIMSARNYSYGEKKSVITGAENLAFNRRSSASGQGSAGAQDYAGAGQAGTYSDGASAYGAGELEGMGTSKKITVDVSHDEEAKAKAQRDAKIAKGEALGKQARGTLKTSKMADASGIKGMPTGSTSMTYGTMGSSGVKAAGAADSSRVSLNQAGLTNVKLQSAKAGKLGAMGAGGVEADGKKLGRASIGQNYHSLGDLGRASKYSLSAKRAVSGDSAKGAADAAAAFDGSKEAEAVNLEGDNLQQAALNTLDDLSDLDTSAIKDSIDYIKAQQDKYNDLVSKANTRYWAALGVAIAGFIASFAVIQAKAGGPWCYLIAGIICTVNAAVIAGVLWGGADSYANVMKEIGELSKANGGITPGTDEMWGAWGLFGMLNALMAAAFIPGVMATFAFGAIEEIIRARKPHKM